MRVLFLKILELFSKITHTYHPSFKTILSSRGLQKLQKCTKHYSSENTSSFFFIVVHPQLRETRPDTFVNRKSTKQTWMTLFRSSAFENTSGKTWYFHFPSHVTHYQNNNNNIYKNTIALWGLQQYQYCSIHLFAVQQYDQKYLFVFEYRIKLIRKVLKIDIVHAIK